MIIAWSALALGLSAARRVWFIAPPLVRAVTEGGVDAMRQRAAGSARAIRPAPSPQPLPSDDPARIARWERGQIDDAGRQMRRQPCLRHAKRFRVHLEGSDVIPPGASVLTERSAAWPPLRAHAGGAPLAQPSIRRERSELTYPINKLRNLDETPESAAPEGARLRALDRPSHRPADWART